MTKVPYAIHALARLRAPHLDAATVEQVLELAYWCQCTLALITVKTVGRLEASFDAKLERLRQPPPASQDRYVAAYQDPDGWHGVEFVKQPGLSGFPRDLPACLDARAWPDAETAVREFKQALRCPPADSEAP